jgi:hypothetical protein
LEFGEVIAAVAEDGDGAAFAEAGDEVGGNLFVAFAGGDESAPELVDGGVRLGQVGGAVPDNEAAWESGGGRVLRWGKMVADWAALEVEEFLQAVFAARRGGEPEDEAGRAGFHDGLEAGGGDVVALVDDDVGVGREEGFGVG